MYLTKLLPPTFHDGSARYFCVSKSFWSCSSKRSKHNIAEIIDGKRLMDLSRSKDANRLDNRQFRFNLLRCLRMDIWETTEPEHLKCPFCEQDFDTKGDHLYQCSHLSKQIKTKMHNKCKWRDMWHNEMQTLIPYIHLTVIKIDKEKKGLVRIIGKSKVYDHSQYPFQFRISTSQ